MLEKLNPQAWKGGRRLGYPEVVVPLASSAPAPTTTTLQSTDPNAEKKPNADSDSNAQSLTKAPSQENGVSVVPEYGVLTLEALRAEVESAVAASGHDSVYDRMYMYTSSYGFFHVALR